MQKSRRNDKARGIAERIGGIGQFGAVRVAVKDREKAHRDGRDPEGRLRRHHDADAEYDGRGLRAVQGLDVLGLRRLLR